MSKSWRHDFHRRLVNFQNTRQGGEGLSIKIRIASGCCERRCSPNAWKIIDNYLSENYKKIDDDFEIVEHESGPEILVQLALTTAVISLAKSIIDLIVVIIKAIFNGAKNGDKAKGPVELIVRRVNNKDEFKEEIIFRVNDGAGIDKKELDNLLRDKINKLFDKGAG